MTVCGRVAQITQKRNRITTWQLYGINNPDQYRSPLLPIPLRQERALLYLLGCPSQIIYEQPK
ncbi:hypothetical protein PS893_00473 [Pseudomonas fluorescens]|nr:hypothetical protein PS893_00473 [Pseudomonas fluorescens]